MKNIITILLLFITTITYGQIRTVKVQGSGGGGGGGGTTYTATNGLTLTSTAFGLGGTLTGTTNITQSSNAISLTQGSYKTLMVDPANDTIALRLVHTGGAESLIKIGDNSTTPRITIAVQDNPNGQSADNTFGASGASFSVNATSSDQRLVNYNLNAGGIQTTYQSTNTGSGSGLLQGINVGDHPYLQLASQGAVNLSSLIIDDTAINISTPIFRINGVEYGTFNEVVIFAPTTTSSASFNLPTGAAPTSPVDGDVWREDNTNTGLKIRVNGVTKTISLL